MILLVLNLLININKFLTFRTRNLANVKEMILKKKSGNPILGFDKNLEILYVILVDGDTVYAYIGPHKSTEENYMLPDCNDIHIKIGQIGHMWIRFRRKNHMSFMRCNIIALI